MAEVVIVHGAWGGGWEWRRVADELHQRGHRVFTPTLTGFGERAHLGGQHVGMQTLIEDVRAVLEFEELSQVVLIGGSFGGLVVTAVASAMPDRVAALLYVDALVPRDGQSGFDLLPPSFTEWAREQAVTQGDGWRVPVPIGVLPPEGLIAPKVRAAYIARLRDQPLRTFEDPVHVGDVVEQVPRGFIRCTGGELESSMGEDPIGPGAQRALSEGWWYRTLAAPHDAPLFAPRETAALIDEFCSTVS